LIDSVRTAASYQRVCDADIQRHPESIVTADFGYATSQAPAGPTDVLLVEFDRRTMTAIGIAVIAGLCLYHALNHFDIALGGLFPQAYTRPHLFAAASLVESAAYFVAAYLAGPGWLRCALIAGGALHFAYVPGILWLTELFRRHFNDFTSRRVRFDDALGVPRRVAILFDVAMHAAAAFVLVSRQPAFVAVFAAIIGAALYSFYSDAAGQFVRRQLAFAAIRARRK
jgi:hypothetical protein